MAEQPVRVAWPHGWGTDLRAERRGDGFRRRSTHPTSRQSSRRFPRLPAAFAQCRAHGITDDSRHVRAQPTDPVFDLVESLLRSSLKGEQVLVHALDLPGEESERALELADAAFQFANLSFDVHRHGKSLSQRVSMARYASKPVTHSGDATAIYSAASVLPRRASRRLSTGARNCPV